MNTKKLFAITIIITVMLSLVSAHAQTDKEITFRDVPWGISYNEAKKKFASFDLWSMSGEFYKTFSTEEIIRDNGGIDFEYTDINVIGNTYAGETNVAGYTTKDITFYFAYKPVDGILTKESKDTAMYAARYELATSDLETMEADLTQKLTELYGEPDKTDVGDNLWGTEYRFVYWYGANNTGVAMTVHDPSVNTFLSEDSVLLTYFTLDGDEWLQEASDAEAYRESLGKNASPDSGDRSGL